MDEYLDAETRLAHRTPTSSLFHYTSADAALFGILASGTLRLSPFVSTNDLWESRPSYPNLTADDDSALGSGMEVWEEIDRLIRRNAKVACLTQDWTLPSEVMNPEAVRGWAHPSMWAHYGAAHSGVCLEFDKDQLITAVVGTPDDSHVFHGPVRYLSYSSGAGPHGIDLGQAREFGLDAVSLAHAENHHQQIFFQKHIDWENEAEYRLVRIDSSLMPHALTIRQALTGVYLGDGFPASLRPALNELLTGYPNTELHQIRYHNRQLHLWPDVQSDGGQDLSDQWRHPRRAGTPAERLAALRDAERTAVDARQQGEAIAAPLLQTAESTIQMIAASLRCMPQVRVDVTAGIDAVPAEQRARRPGVPGDTVAYQAGHLVVATDTHNQAHTLVVSTAIQILDVDQVRMHAAIRTEDMTRAPDHQKEYWRHAVVTAISDAPGALGDLATRLMTQVNEAGPAFNEQRGV